MTPIAPTLIGNLAVRQYLRTILVHGAVGGSFLFVGPSGIGKRSVAIAFAQALQCQGGDLTSAPCQRCASCLEWRKGTHPDALIVVRDPDRAVILLDQIRPTASSNRPTEATLQHRLGIRPLFGQRQVVMIDGAEALNSQSANALLKSLEEPGGNTVILLIAETASALPKTVVSRCAVVNFSCVSADDIRTALLERFDLPSDRLDLIVRLAEGRPGEAVRLAGEPERLQSRLDLVDELITSLSVATNDPFHLSDRFLNASRKEESLAADMLHSLSVILHDFVVRAAGLPHLAVLRQHSQTLEAAARRANPQMVTAIGESFWTLQSRLACNVTPRAAFDAFTNSVATYVH